MKLFEGIQDCLGEENKEKEECKQMQKKIVFINNYEMEIHLIESESGSYIMEEEDHRRVRRNSKWCPPQFICHGRTNVTKLYPKKFSQTLTNEQMMKPPTKISLKIKRVKNASLKTLVRQTKKTKGGATKLVVKYRGQVFVDGMSRQKRDTQQQQQQQQEVNSPSFLKIFTSLQQSLKKLIKTIT